MSGKHREIFVFGYPSDCGGASTELWSLLQLWRRHDVDVTLIPTWTVPTGWRKRTEEIGCRTLLMRPPNVDLPAGSTVVSLCNGPFLAVAPRLINCRLIYLPCMNRLNGILEAQTVAQCGSAMRYVFQSRHQEATLRPQLKVIGLPAERCRRIPGPLELADFPFRPRHRGDGPFTFGRLSRPDPRKFTADWWEFCNRVKAAFDGAGIKVACRVMGFEGISRRKCGRPPDWVEVLPRSAEPVGKFLGSLDCLVQFGDETENWPRVGLEAMAAGVPVIADNRGGWREMLGSGSWGLGAGEEKKIAIEWMLLVARDEPLRLQIAQEARERVEGLADEEMIWESWRELFDEGIGN